MKLLVVSYPHVRTMDAEVEGVVKLIERVLYPNTSEVSHRVVKSFVVRKDIFNYVKESIVTFARTMSNSEGIAVHITEDGIKIITSNSKYSVKFNDKESVVRVSVRPRKSEATE